MENINDPFSGFSSREDFLKERKERDTSVNITEQQKTYIWTRIFLNDEDSSLEAGDKVYIKYIPNGEVLEATFAAYNKKSNFKDRDGDIVQEYNPEDDNKVLCIAVDIDWINNLQNDIPFMRTLFKQSRFYEHQLLKYTELKIYSDEKEFEYHSIDF